MRFTEIIQRLQTDNLPSPGKRQTERFQCSQEYQQEIPLPGIRIKASG